MQSDSDEDEIPLAQRKGTRARCLAGTARIPAAGILGAALAPNDQPSLISPCARAGPVAPPASKATAPKAEVRVELGQPCVARHAI